MKLATGSTVQRPRVAMVRFCAAIMLGTLLAACGGAAAPESSPRPETVVQQEVLRPRVISAATGPSAAPPGTTITAAPSHVESPAPAAAPESAPEPSSVTTPAPDATAFIQVAPGENHMCALQQNGQVLCWGLNDQGQLNVPDGVRFRQITSGWRFSCGIRIDGGITCWGRNNHQQAEAPDGQFTSVDAGWDHACAVSLDRAPCWGRNANGRATPPPGALFTAIGAGAEHSCGLSLSGDLICWGKNDNGRGDSRSGPFRSLTVGVAHTCVLRSDGTALCQGENAAGQSDPPKTVFTQISAGSDHVCGLVPTGVVECWGRDVNEAGNVRFELPGPFTSINAGWEGHCGLNAAGHAHCWWSPYKVRPPPPYDRLNLIPVFPGHALDQPTEVFPWPAGGFAVADKSGTISVYGTESNPAHILDLTDDVDSAEYEKGLLSAALDPKFSEFPFLYVYYTAQGQGGDGQAWARLTRFPVIDDRVVRQEELIILSISRPKEQFLHWGGAIRFGPDGMLYLGIGDAKCLGCPQGLDTLHGKIIRIDVRGASDERPYRIPDDNPFLETADARPEIWAYGLRNPWRMAFDPKDGRLWVGDVGHNKEEEVSVIVAGANLGWPIFEGSTCLAGYACDEFENLIAPVTTYRTVDGSVEGCGAVVGGVVYRGAAIPQLDGVYLFGDFCGGTMWALDNNAEAGLRKILIAELPYPLSSFGTDAAGEVYVLTFGGPLLRLVAAEAGSVPSSTVIPLGPVVPGLLPDA